MAEPDLTALDDIVRQDPRRSSRRGSICGVALARRDNPDKVDLIDAALEHPASGRAVASFLRDNGIDISQASVTRHRRGDGCQCQR